MAKELPPVTPPPAVSEQSESKPPVKKTDAELKAELESNPTLKALAIRINELEEEADRLKSNQGSADKEFLKVRQELNEQRASMANQIKAMEPQLARVTQDKSLLDLLLSWMD